MIDVAISRIDVLKDLFCLVLVFPRLVRKNFVSLLLVGVRTGTKWP
jgi:hypothetical protein